ncbi:26S proteasome non-ATPase regulatory subunit 8 [Histomonas meleagridis]|uniref:26S proteasome non-ATPase regulatory subunit 8 n=1 Tax=Histomonas meleagridis TaxID=135588 RepID=UPI00355ABA13|nr:26S proteasome non-ATPase regulatory subunit 8 [Histomonas meleagridis]KAH0801821.1 26S proteasome non-ATPase regulatory subunit 8 [Histomonas meleagridis]
MSDFQAKYSILKEVDAKCDTTKALELIHDLKLMMIQMPFLTKDEDKMTQEQIIMCRDILEIEAISSLKVKNLTHFEQVIKQLKTTYFRKSTIPKSDRMPLLLSLYLVDKLSLGQFIEFNIELPIVLNFVPVENEFIKFALDLERAVLDNSFLKLFALESNAPSPLFQQLTARLLEGARNNHADSIERSYKSATVDEIAKILHFKNTDEAKEFIQKRNWNLSADGSTVNFALSESALKAKQAVDNAARYVDLAVSVSTIQ